MAFERLVQRGLRRVILAGLHEQLHEVLVPVGPLWVERNRASDGVEVGGSWTITGHADGEILRGQAALGFHLLEGAWNLGIDYT